MPTAPVETRARLLTDRGSGYLAAAFEDYPCALGIRHIYCAPHHPQTNGKLERFHETLKARLKLLVYTSPEGLRAAMADFIRLYNHERYHEGIGNVTPGGCVPWPVLRNSPTTGGSRTPDAGPAGSLQSGRREAGTRGELLGELSVPHRLPESRRR
jgi:hypothetical protein